MRTIWLVRHGQSQAQTDEDDDWRDPALSDLGKRQSARLAEPLRDAEFDRILISPMRRAMKTFELSQAKGRVVEIDTRVAESDWGHPNCYESLLPLTTPGFAQPDRHHALLESVEDRVEDLLADLLSDTEGSILMFGHWGVFSLFHRRFVGAAATAAPVTAHMDNTAISVLELDDDRRRHIRCWNDRAHVSDLLE